MDELRVRWEVPSIAYFVTTFHRVFELPELHVEELEEAFLTSCTQDGSDLLNQLLASLLSGYYSSKNIKFYNYESSLRDCLHQKWTVERDKENPLTNAEFRNVSLGTKVEIIYSLCMYRLDADDVAESVKQLSSEEMRIEPVGKDDEGASYWNFNDERLYKETKPIEPPEKNKKKKKHKEKHKKKKGKNRDSDDGAEESQVIEGKWSLLCSTEEEWQDFVKTLKKSHHKQDKKLRKIIVNDFLPLIPEIIVEKEKAIKKRLLEMLPKRESNRLAKKRAVVDEQKALMAQLEAEEEEERRQAELEKKKMSEQRRKMELARERDERNRAREEEKASKEQARQARAMRAMMREHNAAFETFNSADDNSMSDEESEETDWEEYNKTAGGTQITSRQRRGRRPQNKTEYNSDQLGPKEYEKLHKLLYQLQRNSNCWPFLEPVTKEMAPDYFDIIETPMDISVLRRKSTRKEYRTKQQFVDDFNLIVTNCTKYNGADSEYGRMALNLKEKFESLIEKSFPAQAQRVQRQAQVRAGRTEKGESSAESTASQTEESGSDSDSSYTKPKQKNNNRKIATKRRANAMSKTSMQKPQNKKRVVAETASSSSEDSSGSEESDGSGANQYNYVMSHNASSQASRLLAMSQSQQILTDMPLPSTNPSGRVFGIARSNSLTNVQNTSNGISSMSTLDVKPSHMCEKTGDTSSLTKHPNSVQSPDSGSGNRGDRSANIARWLSKSNSSSGSNGFTSPPLQQSNGGDNNIVKVQEITRPQQPFEGLVAQLKRSSVENVTSAPPCKRVA